MFPLGSYDRLVHEIKRRENTEIPITFGLLIADYRQSRSREYVLNYIDRFNYKSDRYINFYLPGYFEEDFRGSNQTIEIKGKPYYFDENAYMEFLGKLEDDFQVDYSYNPRLILMEYHRGHFNNSKKIVIELDDDGADVKKTGKLFETIFNVAKKEVDIKRISEELMKHEFKKGIFEQVIKAIDNKYITAVYDSLGSVRKYRLSSSSGR